jgi:hypothetical protein
MQAEVGLFLTAIGTGIILVALWFALRTERHR